jgi:glycosyltransferase involved in cell wall biosynthesis
MKLTNALFRPAAGKLRRFYRYRLFDFIFARNDLVITLSEAERRYLTDLYPGREALFHTVPNPYVAAEKLRAPTRRRNSGGSRILTAARFVRQKRLDVMLRAFARIGENAATLTILGDGPLRSELMRLADSLGVSDRIQMPGFVADVSPWLEMSDLFLLSSDYEGLPAVLIEALACNVPVVTTDSFLAARSLLAHASSCAVVERDNPAAFAEAIDKCLAGARAWKDDLREIAPQYDIDASVSAHIELLAKAIAA